MFFKKENRPQYNRPGEQEKGSKLVIVVAIVLAVAVLAGLVYWFTRSSDSVIDTVLDLESQAPANTDTKGMSSDYKAVFLTNGQVYFGRLEENRKDQFINMSEVYYLQVQEASGEQAASGQGSQTSLVRLGTEMHGPEGTMEINRDHILFIENLRPDSSVVQAIQADEQ